MMHAGLIVRSIALLLRGLLVALQVLVFMLLVFGLCLAAGFFAKLIVGAVRTGWNMAP